MTDPTHSKVVILSLFIVHCSLLVTWWTRPTASSAERRRDARGEPAPSTGWPTPPGRG